MVRSRRTAARGLFGAFVLIVLIASAGSRLVAAASDIVLYTSDFTRMQGNWASAATSGAAGGQRLSGTDYNWSAPNSALAAPADYVEATFSAPASTAFHVWLRLRAGNDSKYNDSVWVQFNDAVSANGSSLYPIGSASGLLVNLENCAGCAVAGWGWQDKAYWLQQTTVVQFASSGTHTIRIQTREDGVQIDQVVFSPATYLTNSPGQVTNDSTIVPKPSATTIVSTSTPYTGAPAAIPGIIQAENFDNGAEGVAYHDTTSGNTGSAFRQTDVDIERSSSGGYDIGWVAAGEWLNYTVTVATAGAYTAQFHVASLGQGGTFHLEMNGANVTGAMTIPNSGGWQTWQTLSKTVSLAAGQQTARLVMDTAGTAAVGNFEWMQFTAATTAPPTPVAGAPAAPNSPNPPDGTTSVTVTPNLSWKAAGASSYDVRLGTTNPPPTIVSNTRDYWYAPSALAGGTKYYWQIVARNSSGGTTGPVWSFTTAGVLPPPPPPPPAFTSTAGVAVVTWNIQVNDSSAAHARTAMDQLAALSPQPQVIVIEEGRQTQVATYLSELQARTGVTWQGVFQPHCPLNAWNGSSCTVAEDEGVGVFTSLPIVGSSTTYLPYADGYHSARSAVRVAVNANGRTLQIFGAHMQGVAAARNSSMPVLKNWASGFSTPQIVAGDFNADPDQIDLPSAMGGAFVDSWSVIGSGRGFTCSTPNPTMKLDYWFADASGKAQPSWTYVVTSTGTVSDHFPVVAYFALQ
jgi:endonuclease/exonuclease/phosphatase family metal-dependent hydrolase